MCTTEASCAGHVAPEPLKSLTQNINEKTSSPEERQSAKEAPLADRSAGGPLRWRTAPLADRSAGGPLRWRTAPLADRWRRWRRSSGQCWRTVRLAVWRGSLCWQATVPQLHLVEKHHQIAQRCALLEPPGGRFIKKPCWRVKAILALARQQKGSTPMILNQLASWCNGQHSGL